MPPVYLYLSIPFCKAHCAFCDQITYPAQPGLMHEYTEAVIREMEMTAPDFAGRRVKSITLGGGSPALLSSEMLARLMKSIRGLFEVDKDVEITLETSPNRIRAGDVVRFQNLGINRLALGIVTARTAEAEYLGMQSGIGSAETAMILPQMFHLRSYESTILYGIPGQSAANFQTSLKFVVRYNSPEIVLRPLKITEELYSKVQEEREAGAMEQAMPAAGQAFRAHKVPEEQEAGAMEQAMPVADQAFRAHKVPEERELRAMKQYAADHLTEKGYHEYLPDCWAKPGHESISRRALKSRQDYLSFGPGTVSRTDGILYRTTANLQRYMTFSTEPDMLYQVGGTAD